jgi:hypothetical protein
MNKRSVSRESLVRIINKKISRELKLFKKELLKKEPEHIFAQAYHIDVIVNIYELMAEKIEELSKRYLYELLVIPNILEYFYQEWLKTEDSFVEELRESMRNTLKNSQFLRKSMKRRA